jgi:hypothetical protein
MESHLSVVVRKFQNPQLVRTWIYNLYKFYPYDFLMINMLFLYKHDLIMESKGYDEL